jgi:hypothetical protein
MKLRRTYTAKTLDGKKVKLDANHPAVTHAKTVARKSRSIVFYHTLLALSMLATAAWAIWWHEWIWLGFVCLAALARGRTWRYVLPVIGVAFALHTLSPIAVLALGAPALFWWRTKKITKTIRASSTSMQRELLANPVES